MEHPFRLFAIMKKCLEIKKFYNGSVRSYLCHLLYLKDKFGILQYHLEKDYVVHDLILPKGTQTLGFFWENRPYNIYLWRSNSKTLGWYFNIADSTELKEDKFIWRDLVLDILILDDKSIQILDQHELAQISNVNLLKYIHQAKSLIVETYSSIIKEIINILNSL